MHNFRQVPVAFFSLALAVCLVANADDPVFRSEVSMSRVDARVVDRDGHAVLGLGPHDFVLKLGDKELPVRNFANENTPIDILFLLDVSGSMEPHVERIAMAAHQALEVLGDQDRVGIMVFDSRTRVRLPFRNNRSDVTRELNKLLEAESFNGGTRITSALFDAAKYVEREARPDARRAIVILTDDMTQDQNNEGRVGTALRNARAILSFLRAPYDEPSEFGGGGIPQRRGGTWGSGGGGGWPGGGGGWPGGGGGIGFPGRRGGGGGMPGLSPSHSAGTETIALESGGDAMNVQEAAALEDTLARLRQRYALYFYLPEELASRSGAVRVNLAESASLRYHGAEIQSRRVVMAAGNENNRTSEPAAVTRVALPPEQTSSETTPPRRSRAVNENSGPNVNSVGQPVETAAQPANAPAQPAASTPQPTAAPAQKGGWPRVPEKTTAPPNQFATGTY